MLNQRQSIIVARKMRLAGWSVRSAGLYGGRIADLYPTIEDRAAFELSLIGVIQYCVYNVPSFGAV